MTRPHVNPVHKIMAGIGWLCLWSFLAYSTYTGYVFYRAYDSGYSAGVRAGQIFAQDVRLRNLRALTYTRELAAFTQQHEPRGGSSWKDALHRHAWETGLDSVMANVPH